MKNTQTSLFKSIVLAATVTALTACGGGSNTESETTPTPAPTAAPTPSPSPAPASTPTPSPARVSKLPEIYYFDANGQWHLVAGVTAKQAKDAGALCEYRADDATRNAYLAAGRTVEWVDANITILNLCPGY